MELTTSQIVSLSAHIALPLLVAVAVYWPARSNGYRRGHAIGYREGFDAAETRRHAELIESAERCRGAERLLAATRSEMQRVQKERDQTRRNAAEALEELTLRLDETQALNTTHADLLRQSAANHRLAAASWRSLGVTQKEKDAHTLAKRLTTLAGWLKPQGGMRNEETA